MQVLGITGGIATGKSTVLGMLERRGACVASADTMARELTESGGLLTAAVAAAFPNAARVDAAGVIEIDRRALADHIFADPPARGILEAILHPAIIARLQAKIAVYRSGSPERLLALEIPLLFEAGLQSIVDLVVVVACDQALQLDRMRARWGIDDAAARQMLAAQWPVEDKIAAADIVIRTSGDLAGTERQVADIWSRLV